MNSLRAMELRFAWAIALVTLGLASPLAAQTPAAVRNFEFTYITRIPRPPAGARTLRIWIPLPQASPYQMILDLEIESPFPYSKHRDPEYGDEYVVLQIPAEKIGSRAEVRMSFQVGRREHRVSLNPLPGQRAAPRGGRASLKRLLQSDRLVPIQGVIAELSEQQTRGIQDPLAKARAIYNYVIATLRYDKAGTGWGRGDAVWACTAKYGNCTDFHALFIGMMRAAGIPAQFEIGFPLPAEQHEGAIPGYHCWAEFYLEPYGWVPVDASEAWKHPDKRDYFFGAHDENRVQFTIGRDIRLDPAPKGSPLNYFIYPYAELDGKSFAVESTFSFKDVAVRAD